MELALLDVTDGGGELVVLARHDVGTKSHGPTVGPGRQGLWGPRPPSRLEASGVDDAPAPAHVERDLVRELPRWLAARLTRWTPEGGDAALYAASALFAAITALFAGITLYAQWGEMAVGPYVAASVASALTANHHRRRRMAATPDRGGGARPAPEPRPGGENWRPLRIWIFVFVLIGATLVPLALEIVWRSDGTNASSHVQPEVAVVEQAGDRVAQGKNPYQLEERDGHVVSSVPGQPTYESFFPYLPLMTVFGLPASTKGPLRLTDARIFFSLFTLVVTAVALVLCRGPTGPKVRTLQVLTVLPTAALPLATGGDDMVVVALLLLAMVLAQQRRPGWSGVVLGVASSMKFTAWPLAALALFAARGRDGRRSPGRMALGMLVVAAPVVTPFIFRNPHDFLENVILFPLGLAGVASPAASPLPGHALVSAFPHLHRIFPITAAVVGGAILLRHLLRHPPQSAGAVCTLTGWVMTVAILLAPATRIGYVLYPINFFVWGHLLSGVDAREELAAESAVGVEAGG